MSRKQAAPQDQDARNLQLIELLKQKLPKDAKALEIWERDSQPEGWNVSSKGLAYSFLGEAEQAQEFAEHVDYLISSILHAATQKDSDWVTALCMIGASYVIAQVRETIDSHALARACSAIVNAEPGSAMLEQAQGDRT